MYWNEIKHPSLKTRIALSYTLLFLLSCSAILLLIFILMQYDFYRSTESRLQYIANHTRKVHVIGKSLQIYNEILTEESYPEKYMQILRKQFKNLKIIFVCTRHLPIPDNKIRKIYTVYAVHNGKYYEMRVNHQDLSVYSKLINTDNNKFQLQTYFSRMLVSSGQENLFISFCRKDHSVFLHAGENTLSEAQIKSLHAEEKLNVIGNFACKVFPFSDQKYLLIGVNIKPYQQWHTIAGLAGCIILILIAAAGAISAWLLTRRFIRGINRTTMAMQKISSGNYSYRVRSLHSEDKEIRELVQTFNTMNERTENLLQELKMVTDNVAHDLRTPLTRISGVMELLLTDRNLPEKIRTDCVSIAEEINRLKNVVNTIMDISRTNSRPGEIIKQKINIIAMLRDFCDFFEPVFEDKGLKFYLSLPEKPVYIMADKDLLARLLSNLLENALKFTNNGFVAVSIQQVKNQLFLRIADSGCGISRHDLQFIFNRFFRSDTSRHLQGNGLGLALVKAIANAHHWKIDAASCIGEGTVFLLTIDQTEPTAE